MKKYIVFPLLLLGGFFAAGCGTKNTADDNSLVVLNYGKYMDSSVLKLFEQETGIHVKLEEYESPEEKNCRARRKQTHVTKIRNIKPVRSVMT